MKTKTIAFLVIAAVVMSVVAISAVAVAKPPTDKIPNGPAGNSNIAHLYLCEKVPYVWTIVEDGAWGKMKYNLAGPTFDFVFNGHGLNPGDYTLIYYPDDKPDNPWPRVGIRCLASGTADDDGNIHLAGSIELDTDLPCSGDWNINPDPDYCDYNNGFDDYDHCSGAKIWLVESSAVNCATDTMSGWNPTEYLFETDLIEYDDTEV
jgi:hypothetical protein